MTVLVNKVDDWENQLLDKYHFYGPFMATLAATVARVGCLNDELVAVSNKDFLMM